ncbi:MAG: hypothetical protein IKN49_05365 [Elusimicrobiaceae bacterium]|nr:hypothetical protein [Elusimicrobiaceae bacterium]
MKKIACLLFCVFLNSFLWAGEGKTLTITGGTYSSDVLADSETASEVDSQSNTLSISGGTFNKNAIAGQSDTGNAANNTLQISGGTFNESSLMGGISLKASASENTVTLKSISTSGSVAGGFAPEGEVTKNTVTISDGSILYNTTTPNYVVGGASTKNDVSLNEINITQGSVINTTVAGGYNTGTGDVFSNTVSITGNSDLTDGSGSGETSVYGGYATYGTAYENKVVISNANTIGTTVYGGYSDTSYVENNSVQINGTTLSANIYGAYTKAASSDVVKNTVHINSGSTISGTTVAGGWSDGSGTVKNNQIVVSADVALDNNISIYGGYATSGDAKKNSVTLHSASTGGEIIGGYSGSGAASQNTLTVDNTQASGTVFAAGWAPAGAATDNTATLSNVTLTGSVYGGYGQSASGNTVNLTNAILSGDVYGGYATAGEASGNKTVINGAGKTITGNVYGGYSNGGAASGNQVDLSQVTVTGDVYGGYTAGSAATTNNTVYMDSTTVLSGGLFGGNGTDNTGNLLYLKNYVGVVPTFSNFDSVIVYGLNSSAHFQQTVNAVIVLQGRPDEITQTLLYTPDASSTVSLARTKLGAYLYELSSTTIGSEQAWQVTGGYQNKLAKPYAQAQLAGLTLAGMGRDLLTGTFQEALSEEKETNGFLSTQFYDNSYKTGSSFDMKSFVAQAGRWYQSGGKVFGGFVQYGHGSYSTHPVDAEGGLNTYALGVFALLPYSEEGYVELIARGGYQTDDFTSDELDSELDRKGFFGGFSAGISQQLAAVRFYGRGNWLALQGDNLKDDLGQKFHFKTVQSLTGQAGVHIDLGTIANKYKPYVDVSGIYEALGESNVTLDKHKIKDADLGGWTGKGALGVTADCLNALIPMKSSFSVFGLVGRAQGWGADIRLMFAF